MLDFIEIYENALNAETCEFFRSKLTAAIDEGRASSGEEESRTGSADCSKNDYEKDPVQQPGALNRHDIWHTMDGEDAAELLGRCTPAIDACFQQYSLKYAALQKYKFSLSTLRVQKSYLHGGLHFWHFENWPKFYGDDFGPKTTRKVARQLAFLIYLNDIPPGEGETEFLYIGKRIQPQQGRLVIFPAGFTHTHRANPVYSQEKYIIAGNIEFDLPEVAHVNSA